MKDSTEVERSTKTEGLLHSPQDRKWILFPDSSLGLPMVVCPVSSWVKSVEWDKPDARHLSRIFPMNIASMSRFLHQKNGDLDVT